MINELEVDSVYKNFGEFQLLNGCYLQCKTGEIVGILGRNGCGKSSLLKIIFGSLTTELKTIRINKKVYSRPFKNGSLVAYLPQSGFLPKFISIEKIIELFIDDKAKQQQIAENERIKPHLLKRTTELSGGELRYFEILLLVNLNVQFVLLDEPFSGIEPLFKEAVKELIKENRKTKGFILTDHDYRNIIDISDRIVLIRDGISREIKSLDELEKWNYVPFGTFKKF